MILFDTDAIGTASVDESPGSIMPASLTAWPNPFSEQVVIRYRSHGPAGVRILVHDLLGRIVAVLHDGPSPPDSETAWIPSGLPAGVYIATVEAGEHRISKPVFYRP